MKKFFVASASVAGLIVLVPTAQAKAPTHRHIGVYYYLRRHVIAQDGRKAPGRNVLKDGRSDGKPVTDAVIRQSNTVMERMLAPPPPQATTLSSPSPVATSTTASTPSTAVVTSSSNGYSIPSYIVQCESGGNWSAVNASSGAGGAYQIMPSTWQAYGGTGLPENASPAQQSAIAAKIWAASGASAWSCG